MLVLLLLLLVASRALSGVGVGACDGVVCADVEAGESCMDFAVTLALSEIETDELV